MFYYSWLIIIGNDVNPQTDLELFFCAVIVFFGAFFEAYIIGAITAEMFKADDKEVKKEKLAEYAKYSLDIHKLPDDLK